MPISYDKRNKRYRYQFNRVVSGARQRANRLLPQGWTPAQAAEFDRIETARLYSLAAGVTKSHALIDDAVLAYLEEHAAGLKNFKGICATLAAMQPWYAGKPIEELAAVATVYTADKRGTVAPATLRNHLAYLRAACRWAWKYKSMGEHDPAGRMVMPRVSNTRNVYLDRVDMLKICRTMKQTAQNKGGQRRARAVFRISFYSGMRLGEVMRAQIIKSPGGLLFVLHDTKNGNPRRVPVHQKIAHIVSNPALWPVTLNKSIISHYVKTAMRAAGHGHARLHDARHSTASEMINAGVDLYTVGGVLGHESAVSTRRYAHLVTGTLRTALNQIGKRKVA